MYWIVKYLVTPIVRVLVRVRVEGRENVPRRGPVILASNHRSFLDSIFIPMVMRRRVTFVAKAEYFDDPKTAWFFRGVGQIPIRREGGVLRRPEDRVVLSRGRPDPDPARGRKCRGRRARGRDERP